MLPTFKEAEVHRSDTSPSILFIGAPPLPWVLSSSLRILIPHLHPVVPCAKLLPGQGQLPAPV